ncbi:hypothetical protein V5O48_015425 [Marasmius crinis-equi]|uniref:Glycosyl transferase CAP10 domain-containing protein n=1 Tax=Marasmius crinis-equi TaxID=585013 RepID=A0ABR3EUK0_9AGAR
MVTSTKVSRYSKLVLAAALLWIITIYGPSFFFRLSLEVDHDEQVPLPSPGESHHQLDHSNEPPLPLPDSGHQETPEQKEAEKPKPGHHYREDGLVEANPEAPHPIFELIAMAEKEWEQKKQRASTSLEEVVKEYRKRYKRSPPKGFDKWWEYVKLHDVQLPDEYDQIYHDLEPLWGMKAADLEDIQKKLEDQEDSYTIAKDGNGPVALAKYAFGEGKYEQLIVGAGGIVELLKAVENDLPPFRANFNPHDNPNRLTDYEVKDTLLTAAGAGERIGRNGLPKPATLGWLTACSPISRARTMPDSFVQSHNQQIKLDGPAPPSVDNPKFPFQSSATRYPSFPPNTPRSKTFIYDHVKTMDPCTHPALLWTHGVFLSHSEGPSAQPHMIPQFSPCTTTIHHNIHVPTPYAWIDELLPWDNPPWEEREDERLMWRGSDTGIYHAKYLRWESSHRDWLVTWASGMKGTVDVLFDREGNETSPVGVPKALKKARLNPAMVDMGFAWVNQCEKEICDKMKEIYPSVKTMSPKEAGNYKYVMDVDGNGWSGRFKRLMTSHALVFKSTIFPEWYSDRIQPWVHYVPVQVDLSDLYDALMFFRGDGNGDGGHEDLAKKIGAQGREWSKAYWRKEDLTAYFFR